MKYDANWWEISIPSAWKKRERTKQGNPKRFNTPPTFTSQQNCERKSGRSFCKGSTKEIGAKCTIRTPKRLREESKAEELKMLAKLQLENEWKTSRRWMNQERRTRRTYIRRIRMMGDDNMSNNKRRQLGAGELMDNSDKNMKC